jgi:hypothetical protein
MENLIVRCSELKKLMTKPRSKTEEISATTKTWLKDKVKQEVFGYNIELNTKPVLKGIHCEDESIELLNSVVFAQHKKNTERRTNDWLTGEPDIISVATIEDIKSSWSLETFPAFQEDADKAVKDAGYDWQLRGYMLLFDKPEARIRYCMISTPVKLDIEGEDVYLLKDWDNISTHKVDHIEPQLRISTVDIKRDKELEVEMKERYDIANKYYQMYWKELSNK